MRACFLIDKLRVMRLALHEGPTLDDPAGLTRERFQLAEVHVRSAIAALEGKFDHQWEPEGEVS